MERKAKSSNANTELLKVDTFAVSNVREVNGTIFFSLTLNGISINSCRVVESKEYGDFIAFPSNKGKDGKYYNIVYAKLSINDTEKILAEIGNRL